MYLMGVSFLLSFSSTRGNRVFFKTWFQQGSVLARLIVVVFKVPCIFEVFFHSREMVSWAGSNLFFLEWSYCSYFNSNSKWLNHECYCKYLWWIKHYGKTYDIYLLQEEGVDLMNREAAHERWVLLKQDDKIARVILFVATDGIFCILGKCKQQCR